MHSSSFSVHSVLAVVRDSTSGGGPPPVLRERGYCKLNERLHHCLSEAFQSEDEVKASAHADWLHDLDHEICEAVFGGFNVSFEEALLRSMITPAIGACFTTSNRFRVMRLANSLGLNHVSLTLSGAKVMIES